MDRFARKLFVTLLVLGCSPAASSGQAAASAEIIAYWAERESAKRQATQ